MLVVVVAWVTIFGPAQPAAVPRRGRRRRLLRQQLAADLRRRLLLRPLRRRRARSTTSGRWRSRSSSTSSGPSSSCSGCASCASAAALAACGRGWRSPRSALAARLGDPDGGPLPARASTPRGSTTAPTPAPSELLVGAALAMVWPSRGCGATIAAGARNMLDARRRRRPGGDRADDLADRPVLLLPLPRRLRAALDRDGHGAGRRSPTRPAGSGRRSAGSRCAGSACAPTASTSGTSRSSSSPPRAASHDGRELGRGGAAGRGDLRRLGALLALRRGADPPRRPRPALAAAARRRAGGRGAVSRRGLGRGRALAAVVLVAAVAGHGRRQLGPDAEGSASEREEARGRPAPTKPAPLTRGDPGRVLDPHLLQSRRPHRRLDLGGPDLARIPAARRASGSTPSYAGVGAVEQHMEISGARSIDEQYRRRTERPRSGGSLEARKASVAAGCWPSAPTRRPTSSSAQRSTSSNESRSMMATIGDEPVLWVNVRSLVDDGDPYAAENMDEVERSTARGVPPLPQHARLRLGLRRQRRLVHRRRHPLHLARLPRSRPPDRRRARRRLPGGQGAVPRCVVD